MKVINTSMMLVRPEKRPEETEYIVNGHKMYKPEAGANVDKNQSHERVIGEWWPHKATVIACGRGGIVYGHHLDGGEISNTESKWFDPRRQTQQWIQTLSPTRRPTWRTPEIGDTVHFGYLSINPADILTDGTIWVDITSAFCVTPADGSPRWAIGPHCLVEPLPVVDVGLLTEKVAENTLGTAIVRMIGDGFSEAHPGVEPGMVIRFIVYGDRNPAIEHPSGVGVLTPMEAEDLIGICEDGLSEAELEEMKIAAEVRKAEIVEANRKAGFSELSAATDQERVIADNQQKKEDFDNWTRRMQDKHHRQTFIGRGF